MKTLSSETKSFPLRVLLTVTTGRLLTKPQGPRDNGIGDLYEILGWMTDDSPFTHQLGRFAEECKPCLLRWFPELEFANQHLASFDALLKAEKAGIPGDSVEKWIAQLKIFAPFRDAYDVPRIPRASHTPKDPLAELIELRESKDGIIVVEATP